MKKVILSLTLFGLMITMAQSQIVLFDQTSGQTNSGLVAMDFENLFNAYDSRIADDFEVESGDTWYIDSISIYGFYQQGATDSAGMNITIYQDNNGSIGSQVYTNVFQVDLDPDYDGTITAKWSTPIQLTAGHYWLAASARKDYLNDQKVWYWFLDDEGFGYEAKWENPGGGYNVCTSWTNITANNCVNVAYPDVVFQIFGCYGPTKPSINELPDDTTFCEGPELTLTATSNSSGVNFAWNTGDSTATIQAGEAGQYIVTAYNPTTLCGSTASIYLDVIPAPKSNVVSDTICEGQSKTYLSNCNTCLFQWMNGNTTNQITKNTSGWVWVDMIDTATGCTARDSGWLEIQELPEIQFFPGNPAHGCKGDTMEIGTVQQYAQYFWDNNGWTGIKDDTTLFVTANGTYFLTVTNSLGCIINDTLDVQFHNKPEPNITIDYTSNWKTRLTADPGYQDYLWSNGDTDPVIVVSSSGPVSLTVTDEFGCTGVTDIYVIAIPAGVDESLTESLRVYPVPADDHLFIECESSGDHTVTIYNAMGQPLIVRRFAASKLDVDVSSLPAGHYSVVVDGDRSRSVRYIVVR